MSLANRLSVFFLAMLAVVLIGFSLTLWFLQRWMLLHQADVMLLGTLDTLVASIEIEPDGVEWNPLEHRVGTFGKSGTDVRWRVLSGQGNIIDQSDDFPRIAEMPETLADREIITVDSQQNRSWRTVIDRVAAPQESADAEETPASAGDEEGVPDVPEFPELIIICAIPIAEAQTTMRQLALVLVTLSCGVWTVAAIFGGRLARHTLQPLTAMARAAAGMDGTRGGRLPVAATGDEVEELGRSFNGLLERLHLAFERDRRFTAEASHQLRTPVTIMLGHVDVALRRKRSPVEYRDTLTEVRRQADRLRTIVESLLALARTESLSLPVERMDLAQWLPEHLENFSTHPRAEQIHLELENPSSAVVLAVKELLGQLLDILVDNALKYTAPGTPIIVRLARKSKTTVIDVIDAGPGIPTTETADIFRPFHRGHDAIHDGVPGLGLGLALAMRIATRLEVALEYEPVATGGSRFRIGFGAQPADLSASQLPNQQQPF